jgi:hypothetical protein
MKLGNRWRVRRLTKIIDHGPFDAKRAGVFLSSFEHECARKQASTGTANSTIMELDFTAPAGQTTVPAGTYTVLADSAPGAATAQHKVRDAACNDTKVDATAGSVTLATALGTASSSTVSGAYEIQFPGGASFSGTFSSASYCDTTLVATPGPACVQ